MFIINMLAHLALVGLVYQLIIKTRHVYACANSRSAAMDLTKHRQMFSAANEHPKPCFHSSEVYILEYMTSLLTPQSSSNTQKAQRTALLAKPQPRTPKPLPSSPTLFDTKQGTVVKTSTPQQHHFYTYDDEIPILVERKASAIEQPRRSSLVATQAINSGFK